MLIQSSPTQRKLRINQAHNASLFGGSATARSEEPGHRAFLTDHEAKNCYSRVLLTVKKKNVNIIINNMAETALTLT